MIFIMGIYLFIIKILREIGIKTHDNPYNLLVKISLILSVAVTLIISTFGFSYYLISSLDELNYIVHITGRQLESFSDIHIFFYFSTATYFSLGYGDYVPIGNYMYLLTFLETLLGYITSGLIVAFGFDVFRKLGKKI